jgi:hypothetical protein
MPWFTAKSDGYYTLRDIIMTRCVRYSSAVICAVGALLRTTNCGLCCSTHTCCRGCCCSVIKDFIGVDKWLAHHYPKLKETALKPIECVQNSGDVVYLPARWEACPSPPHSPPLLLAAAATATRSRVKPDVQSGNHFVYVFVFFSQMATCNRQPPRFNW